jgi:hypothetical protein
MDWSPRSSLVPTLIYINASKLQLFLGWGPPSSAGAPTCGAVPTKKKIEGAIIYLAKQPIIYNSCY